MVQVQTTELLPEDFLIVYLRTVKIKVSDIQLLTDRVVMAWVVM